MESRLSRGKCQRYSPPVFGPARGARSAPIGVAQRATRATVKEAPEAAGAVRGEAASTTNHSDMRGLPRRVVPHDRAPSGAASVYSRESPGPGPECRQGTARALQSCLHRARILGCLRMGGHALSYEFPATRPGRPGPGVSARPRGSRPTRERAPPRRPGGASRGRRDADTAGGAGAAPSRRARECAAAAPDSGGPGPRRSAVGGGNASRLRPGCAGRGCCRPW